MSDESKPSTREEQARRLAGSMKRQLGQFCGFLTEPGPQHAQTPAESLVALTGRWFVFWGVGVRLGLAGLRQIVQPRFTARNIFQMTDDEALPLVRELGAANAGTALVALLSIVAPSFVLPASISAALFFGAAGIPRIRENPAEVLDKANRV